MGEATPSAHDAGGRTPAVDSAVVSGTRRKPGFPRAAREAAAGARPVARTTVPDRRGEAGAPDTDGTNAAHVYAVGGKTPAPRCTAISRAKRQPGTSGAAREAPPGARPTAGATVAEPDGEAVAPGTDGRSALRVYAVGGKTAAPRCTAIARAKRQPGTAGAARETAARARPAAGTTVPDR